LYTIWNGTSGTQGISLAWSSTGVNEGEWFNVVARRDSSSNFELIINNQSVAGPTSVTASSTGIGTTDNIRIGHANTIPGNYSYTSDIDVASIILYNTTLTDNEILQNFNAYRDRYGI
jgi:hypothetical protein